MDSALPPDLLDSPGRGLERTEVQEGVAVVDKSDKATNSKKVVQSWVSVAQDKKCLKKYDIEVSTKDGKHTMEIPDDVLSDLTPLWKDFVVGKFLDLTPHAAKVHMVLIKILSYGDIALKVEVYKVNTTTMRFVVSNPKAREKILRRICGILLVCQW